MVEKSDSKLQLTLNLEGIVTKVKKAVAALHQMVKMPMSQIVVPSGKSTVMSALVSRLPANFFSDLRRRRRKRHRNVWLTCNVSSCHPTLSHNYSPPLPPGKLIRKGDDYPTTFIAPPLARPVVIEESICKRAKGGGGSCEN